MLDAADRDRGPLAARGPGSRGRARRSGPWCTRPPRIGERRVQRDAGERRAGAAAERRRAAAERVVADVDAHGLLAAVLQRQRARRACRGRSRSPSPAGASRRRAAAGGPWLVEHAPDERRLAGRVDVDRAARRSAASQRRLAPARERADRADEHVAAPDERRDRLGPRDVGDGDVEPAERARRAPRAARRERPASTRPRALLHQPLGGEPPRVPRGAEDDDLCEASPATLPRYPARRSLPKRCRVNERVRHRPSGGPGKEHMAEVHEVSVEIGGAEIVFETGRLAKQASGAVLVASGDTRVLGTATAGNLRDIDFMPLTVDIEERMYAAGKIPGSFFKREGRAGEKATLIARMIDRPLRPLFPKGWRYETQLVSIPLSIDHERPYDILAMNGASAALMVSNIPFPTPVGAVRIGKVEGNFVVNPTRGAAAHGRPRPRGRRHRRGHPDGRGGRERDHRGGDARRARHRARRDQEAVRRAARARRRRSPKEKLEVTAPQVDEGLYAQIQESHGAALDEATSVQDKLDAPERHQGGRGAGARAVLGRRRRRHVRASTARGPSSRSTSSRRTSSASASRSTRSARTAAPRRRSARSRPRSASCRARTARRCSPAARRRRCRSSRSARRARRCAWTTSGSRRPSATSTTTTSRRSRWARPASCAARSAATSATARSPSARWSR